MQVLLANYLFTKKKCSLPSVGSLYIKNISASSIFGERSISAPNYAIDFLDNDTNSEAEENYIASNKNISKKEAATELDSFSKKINALLIGQYFEFAGVGSFYKSEDDIIKFTSKETQTAFFPFVAAERVIHPNDSYKMLVGEKETNTATMTEYYSDAETTKTDKWWVWAIVLFLLATVAIGIYASQHGGFRFLMP